MWLGRPFLSIHLLVPIWSALPAGLCPGSIGRLQAFLVSLGLEALKLICEWDCFVTAILCADTGG